jgi:hypothetical protein
MIKVIVLQQHAADCHQVSNRSKYGRPERERWYFNGQYIMRDAIGRRPRKRPPHGGERWLVLKCNSINCGGMMIVRERALATLVVDKLLGRRSRSKETPLPVRRKSTAQKAEEVERQLLGEESW